jgi:uncharacterized protein (TIGR03435 family)
MRALLADRFKLAVRNETRDLPIYPLVVAKSGSHLEPSKSDNLRINSRNGLVICNKVTMKQFAENTLTTKWAARSWIRPDSPENTISS